MKEAKQNRDLVVFLTIESGKDLIVSFAVTAPTAAFGIQSLTLLRTPLYEPILEEWERGVSVSFERYGTTIRMITSKPCNGMKPARSCG